MIFVFVVDTSVSMLQRTSMGITLLDCAKSAVEHFLRFRDSLPGADGGKDKYVLVKTAEVSAAVDWRSSPQAVLDELKELKAGGLTRLGSAFTTAFDLLNSRRFLRGGSVGVDNFGYGRLPWMIDPAVVISLLDGSSMTDDGGIVSTLTLPASRSPGAELVSEPFRWDQRAYSVILRNCGSIEPQSASTSGSTGEILGLGRFLYAMADVTGGQSFVVRTLKELLSTMEQIAVCSAPGVVLNIEPSESGNESLGAGHSPRSLMYVRSSNGHWPIPESFVVTPAMSKLPARTAHPTVHFVPVDVELPTSEAFPVDRYELAASPFAHEFCSSAGDGKAWLAYVKGSAGVGLGSPVGAFVRGAGERTVLFEIMPYNFPVLNALLMLAGQMPSHALHREFGEYLSSIPFYYVRELTANFSCRFPGVVDLQTPTLSRRITQYLERVRAQAGRTGLVARNSDSGDVSFDHSALRVPRESLCKHIAMLKSSLVSQGFPLSSHACDLALHSVRISEMGDYREKELESLRPVDEERAARSHSVATFGNPFRKKRVPSVAAAASLLHFGAVDEAVVPVAVRRRRGGPKDSVLDAFVGTSRHFEGSLSSEAARWPAPPSALLPVESSIGKGAPSVSFRNGSSSVNVEDLQDAACGTTDAQKRMLSEEPFYGVLVSVVRQMRGWGGSRSAIELQEAILSLVRGYGKRDVEVTKSGKPVTLSRAASERGRLAELSAQYAQRFLLWRLASQLRDCAS